MNETPTNKPEPGSLDFFLTAVKQDLRDPKFFDEINQERFVEEELPKRTNMTFATIATAYTNRSLIPNGNVVALTPSTVRALIEPMEPAVLEQKSASCVGVNEAVKPTIEVPPHVTPDFLLIESAYVYDCLDWMVWVGECFSGGKLSHNSPLGEALKLAKAAKIPTVFWFKEAKEQVEDFMGVAKLCEHIFASSSAVIDEFKLQNASMHVGHLPIAVEPALFNPHRDDKGGFGQLQRKYFMCFDKFRELSDGGTTTPLAKMMEKTLPYNCWFFESRFDMRSNSSRLPEHFRQRFLGCFRDPHRSYLYKMSDVSLQLANHSAPSARDEQHILEAMASKALVVSNLDGQGTVFDGMVESVANPSDMEQCLDEISQDRGRVRKLTHLAYRHVMQNHTYFARIKTICAALKKSEAEFDLFGTPRISVIMPTRRPELVPFALNNFRNQTYPNCELVIVLHGEEFNKRELEKKLGIDDANVKVVVVPRRETVSTVLNTGIALSTGDYFARMDDDDYYAPNYFLDAMMARNYVDFDICGKAQWMVYFEGKSGIYLHKGDGAAHSTNKAIAGGTFLVKNTGDTPAFFFDRVQGYADVDYIGRNIVDQGKKLVTTDIFNFVQIRRSDLDSHTWTIAQDKFEHGEQICNGFLFAEVAL